MNTFMIDHNYPDIHRVVGQNAYNADMQHLGLGVKLDARR